MKSKPVKLITLITFILIFSAKNTFAQLSAADSAEIIRPLQSFAKAFNNRSPIVPSNLFTPQACVIDEFSPFVWIGTEEISKWYKKLYGETEKQQKQLASMHEKLTIIKIGHVIKEGNKAYIVAPSKLTYITRGKTNTQTSQWIVTVEKINDKWLMSSNAWAIENWVK